MLLRVGSEQVAVERTFPSTRRTDGKDKGVWFFRAAIWQRIFPAHTPTEGLDIGKLARLNVAGGNIRNIALNAAFLAAHAGEPVRMTYILRATRSEYAKLEKPLTEVEIGGWA